MLLALSTAALLPSARTSAEPIPDIVVVGQGTYADREVHIDSNAIDPGVIDSNALMARVPGGASN
jgi:hypothetical protein